MSDVEHTYVDTNNGFGGPALGAGFGGLIGSWFGQGMNGNGFGGGNNNTYVANQLSAIQSQAVSNGLATQQHNELLKAIDKEGCANRELQRQIQTEFIAGALADAKSKVNILEQTQSIVSQLKTTTTAG